MSRPDSSRGSGLEARHSASFWTYQRPCEEALPALIEAYNVLADKWELQHDLLRRLREWDIIAGPGGPGEFTADAPYWRAELDKVLA